jgi:hypothetical protein
MYIHTDVNFTQSVNWFKISNIINSTNFLYASDDEHIIIGSQSTMMEYMIDPINGVRNKISIPHTISSITIEKYNMFFGFNGFDEVCDSYNFTERIGEQTSYIFDKMKDYDTIYITSLNLKKIYTQLRGIVKRPFILVSGSGDCECPSNMFDGNEDEFYNFINWDCLQHWFCQNCLIAHPKITLIPLGLDYHTMMYYTHIRNDRGPQTLPIIQESQIIDICKSNIPFWDRLPICYSNFHYLTTTKYGNDRVSAIKHIPSKLIYYDSKLERLHTFKNQSKFAFVVSPFGQDYECIRTWEALTLGCIPIIRTSPLDELYRDLPVLIINEWTEINTELLMNTIQLFKQKHLNNEFNYDKLYKEYWVNLLIQMKTKCRLSNSVKLIS